MDELPDLDRFSVAEKDELIRRLWAHVGELTAQVRALQAKVLELEARLAQNSRNSSKAKPQSLRKPGERPTGGQKGHKGHTLEKVAESDRTVQHAPPAHCDGCQSPLPEAKVAETRQVFDLPALRFRSPSIKYWPRRAPSAARSAGANSLPAFPHRCSTGRRSWLPWFI
jgi:transposase